ncbi:MAG: tyrosine-type recombinase/integrase [Oleiphilus sp.]
MTYKDKPFSFTKKEIDKLPTQDKRYRCNDPKTRGLFIEVMPSGEKYFRVRGKVNKKDATSTLGRFPDMTRDQARTQAAMHRNKMASGINPNQLKQVQKNEAITLEEVYLDYIAHRNLKPRSIQNYKQNLDCYLEKWKTKPLKLMNEEAIKLIHKTISISSEAQANQTMRFLRAIFNFAKHEYRGLNDAYIFTENPVKILNHLRMWNPAKRKQTRLHEDELGNWFKALEQTKFNASKVQDVFTVSVCDALIMALLTGLRKSEILELTWDRVNLQRKCFFIDKTKNGLELYLPTTPFIQSMLSERWNSRTESPYVFNAPNAKGRVLEPKKTLAKLQGISGIIFGWHDLRRTFASTAERVNIGTYTLKRLMNHKSDKNDVTEGYIIQTAEELRDPAVLIANRILDQAGTKEPKTNLESQISDLLNSLDNESKTQLLRKLSEQKEKVVDKK